MDYTNIDYQNGYVDENGNFVYVKDYQKNSVEIERIKQWFDTYYTQHEQKYNRLIALGKLTDEGIDPRIELTELYETAETNRARIQELENLLKVE